MSADHTPNPTLRATQFASLAALAAVVVGALVLIGWAYDIAVLKSILPGWVSMKPNAAVCFILTGIALWLTARQQSAIRNPQSAIFLARVFGLLAGLIGLLTLSEYIFGWNLGIDQWLLGEPAGTVGTSHPIRMAPEAALNFVLLSVALWITGSSRKTSRTLLVSASLSMLVVAIALAGILSYATLDVGAYGWFGLIIMAMHAAILFALLGGAVIAINWQQNGLQWLFSRNVTAAIACGIALLVFIGFNASRSQFRMKETSHQIAHTEEIKGVIESVQAEVVDTQLHAHDYAITGDERVLKHYLEAKAASITKLDALRRIEIASAEPVHQKHLTLIEAQVKAHLQWLQQIIDARRAAMADAARNNMISHGENLLDNLRSTFGQIDSEHQQTVEQLKREAESVARLSYLIIFTGTLASLLIFMAVILRLNFVAIRQKRAEDSLMGMEAKYHTLFELSADAHMLLDEKGFFDCNPATLRIFGCSTRSEFISKHPAEFSPPTQPGGEDSMALANQRIATAFKNGNNQFEWLHRRLDGAEFPADVLLTALELDGKPVLKATVRDITERKLAEAEMHERDEKFQAIFDGVADGILLADVETRQFVTGNPEICRMLGYRPEEIAQISVTDIHPQQDLPYVLEQFEREVRGELNIATDLPVRRKDGSVFYADVKGSMVSFGGKKYLMGVFHDITERKRMETELQESEARYKRITEGLTDYQYTVRIENGRAVGTTQSPACEAVTGYTAEEFAANPHLWIEMVAPEDRDRVRTKVQQILAGQDGTPIEHRITRKDGETRWISYTVILFKDASGKLLSYDGVIKDITARKQAEIAIQHANRALAALGAVNRTLVHATDENELMQAICQAIVEQKGYRMVWVGYKQQDESKSIKIMARAGQDEGYLEAMQLTWAESERGMCPCGCAIRSGATQVCQDIAHDSQYLPWRDAALQRGYGGNIALPLTHRNGKVFGILSVYAAEVNAFATAEIALLEEMAGDLAFGVRSLRARHERDLAQDKVRQQVVQLQDSLEDTVRAIATIVEMRDPYTAGHQAKVADLAAAIARQMGLPEEQAHAIHLAGVVHDLGKIKIPAEILSKPGKITDIEHSLIKVHPQAGYDILKGIQFPWPIAQMVLQHHERLDGTGYPQGLKGDAILLEARILSVADVVEAMSSHRPYRPGLGIEVALAEITQQRGTHYDPQAVDACVAVFREQGYSFKG